MLLYVTGNVLILKNMPFIIFSDEQEEHLPVPPPRLKRKAKLASITNIISLNKSTDKCVPSISSKQKNQSKASAEKTVILSECFGTDDANENNSLIGTVNARKSATEALNDKTVKSNAVSHTVWKRRQLNHHNVTEREDGEVDKVFARSEGCCEDDKRVYLQKALPFVKTKQNNSLVRTEHDFRSSLLGNSHKVNSEYEVVTGLPKNYTSCLSVRNNSVHLLNEAPTSLCNTHLGKVFPPLISNSHVVIENTGEAIKDTAKIVCKCVEYEESLKVSCTEKSHVYVNSTIGYSGCCSVGTRDVFHERDENICIQALSEDNTVLEFQLPKESVHADTVLECVPAGTGLEPVPANRGVESVYAIRALEYLPAGRGLKPVPAVRELESVPADRESESVPADRRLESVPADRGLESVLADKTLESVSAVISFESMAADKALESSLSISMKQGNFNHLNHRTEKNTYVRQSGLGLLSCNEELSVSLIKSDAAIVKPCSTDISVVNNRTNTSSRNNSTIAADRILQKRTVYDKGYCLYSALENFEAVSDTKNREKQWVVSDNVRTINCERTGCKSKNCRSHAGNGEMHPSKISKSFHLFVKNILMGREENDVSYHGDNTEGSVTFDCAFNQSEDTNLTEKTNKRVLCSELNKEDSTKLPVHSKTLPRCITVETSLKSGVLCDNIHNDSDYCTQHECGSENNCVVSVVSMNTTVPSCDESCQPSLHGEHQLSLTSNYFSNTINSKETIEYVSAISKGVEVSIMKSGEDEIKTNTGESFTTLKKNEALPSSGSTVDIDKSNNNSYSQTVVGSKAPFVAKVKTNPLKKSGVNEECLDGMRIKMENHSG